MARASHADRVRPGMQVTFRQHECSELLHPHPVYLTSSRHVCEPDRGRWGPRAQWDTWSPAGWFAESVFSAAAASFENPDWVSVSLNAYRGRFLTDEPTDPLYDDVRAVVAETEQIGVPTLMIQGEADACDPPEASEHLESYFADYRRVVLSGVGHFPHREAPQEVLEHLRRHLADH